MRSLLQTFIFFLLCFASTWAEEGSKSQDSKIQDLKSQDSQPVNSKLQDSKTTQGEINNQLTRISERENNNHMPESGESNPQNDKGSQELHQTVSDGESATENHSEGESQDAKNANSRSDDVSDKVFQEENSKDPPKEGGFMSRIANWFLPGNPDNTAAEGHHHPGNFLPGPSYGPPLNGPGLGHGDPSLGGPGFGGPGLGGPGPGSGPHFGGHGLSGSSPLDECNPCNQEPWIPVAANVGKNTLVGFVQPSELGHGNGPQFQSIENLNPPPSVGSHDAGILDATLVSAGSGPSNHQYGPPSGGPSSPGALHIKYGAPDHHSSGGHGSSGFGFSGGFGPLDHGPSDGHRPSDHGPSDGFGPSDLGLSVGQGHSGDQSGHSHGQGSPLGGLDQLPAVEYGSPFTFGPINLGEVGGLKPPGKHYAPHFKYEPISGHLGPRPLKFGPPQSHGPPGKFNPGGYLGLSPGKFGPPSGQYGPPSNYPGPSNQYGPPSGAPGAPLGLTGYLGLPPGKFGPPGKYGPPKFGPLSGKYGRPPGKYGPPPGKFGLPPGKYGSPPGKFGPPLKFGPPPGKFGPPPGKYGPPPDKYGPPPGKFGPPPGKFGPGDFGPPDGHLNGGGSFGTFNIGGASIDGHSNIASFGGGSLEAHSQGSFGAHSQGSFETHSQGSFEGHSQGSSEGHSFGGSVSPGSLSGVVDSVLKEEGHGNAGLNLVHGGQPAAEYGPPPPPQTQQLPSTNYGAPNHGSNVGLDLPNLDGHPLPNLGVDGLHSDGLQSGLAGGLGGGTPHAEYGPPKNNPRPGLDINLPLNGGGTPHVEYGPPKSGPSSGSLGHGNIDLDINAHIPVSSDLGPPPANLGPQPNYGAPLGPGFQGGHQVGLSPSYGPPHTRPQSGLLLGPHHPGPLNLGPPIGSYGPPNFTPGQPLGLRPIGPGKFNGPPLKSYGPPHKLTPLKYRIPKPAPPKQNRPVNSYGVPVGDIKPPPLIHPQYGAPQHFDDSINPHHGPPVTNLDVPNVNYGPPFKQTQPVNSYGAPVADPLPLPSTDNGNINQIGNLDNQKHNFNFGQGVNFHQDGKTFDFGQEGKNNFNLGLALEDLPGQAIPFPNLSQKPVVPIHGFQEFSDGIHDIQIVKSIPIADFVSTVEHPVNLIQSPIVEVTANENHGDGSFDAGSPGSHSAGSHDGSVASAQIQPTIQPIEPPATHVYPPHQIVPSNQPPSSLPLQGFDLGGTLTPSLELGSFHQESKFQEHGHQVQGGGLDQTALNIVYGISQAQLPVINPTQSLVVNHQEASGLGGFVSGAQVQVLPSGQPQGLDLNQGLSLNQGSNINEGLNQGFNSNPGSQVQDYLPPSPVQNYLPPNHAQSYQTVNQIHLPNQGQFSGQNQNYLPPSQIQGHLPQVKLSENPIVVESHHEDNHPSASDKLEITNNGHKRDGDKDIGIYNDNFFNELHHHKEVPRQKLSVLGHKVSELIDVRVNEDSNSSSFSSSPSSSSSSSSSSKEAKSVDDGSTGSSAASLPLTQDQSGGDVSKSQNLPFEVLKSQSINEVHDYVENGQSQKLFTPPPMDYSTWQPSDGSGVTTGMVPPPRGASPWLSSLSNGGYDAPKKSKQMQIIVPYTTGNRHHSQQGFEGMEFYESLRLHPKKVTELPMYTMPPTSESVWQHFDQQSSQKVTHVIQTDKPPVSTKSIKDLLRAETQKTSKLPFDVISLQEHIDNWTEQEFSNNLQIEDNQKLSTSSKLVPSKNIPNEYLTTLPYRSKVEETTGRDVDYDHEAAGSSNNLVDLDNNLITAANVEETTEVPTTATAVYGLVQLVNDSQSTWQIGDLDEMPETKEKIYVVTPMPKLGKNLRGGVTEKTRTTEEKIKSGFAEWPHLINDLETTTAKSTTIRHPLFGLMDLSAYTPPPNSTVETISGHSKVITLVTESTPTTEASEEEEGTSTVITVKLD